jgi:hypothetical protein
MFSETPIIYYGDDGPAFARVCPKCRRFIAFPKEMRWKVRFDDAVFDFTPVECKRCGPINSAKLHIGWAGDFR